MNEQANNVNNKLSANLAAQGAGITPLSLAEEANQFFTKAKPTLTKLLGGEESATRLFVNFVRQVQKSPQLLEADRSSLFAALMECATLKLWPGPMKQAALVTYWNKKLNNGEGAYEVQMQPQYQGLLDLAYRTKVIRPPTQCEIVWEADTFSHQMGDNPRITHTPFIGPSSERGERLGVYTVLTTTNGDKVRNYYTMEHIYRYRDQSPSYKSALEKKKQGKWFAESFWLSPNVDTVDWMIKKSALRQSLKLVPMSIDLAEVMEKDDRIEGFTKADVLDLLALIPAQKVEAPALEKDLSSPDAKQAASKPQ